MPLDAPVFGFRGELEELQQKSSQADMDAERYREENNLIGAKGSLVNEQQLAELNSQLTLARAETARAQARYDLIDSLIRSKRTDAAVTEELNNPVMTGAAQQISESLETSGRLDDAGWPEPRARLRFFETKCGNMKNRSSMNSDGWQRLIAAICRLHALARSCYPKASRS